jgi:hypothetical protein
MKKMIVDTENPNGLIIDMTTEEENAINVSNEKANADRDAIFAKEQADAETKATAQASGNQKLLDLGLTQAEATALTGYTPPVAE